MFSTPGHRWLELHVFNINFSYDTVTWGHPHHTICMFTTTLQKRTSLVLSLLANRSIAFMALSHSDFFPLPETMLRSVEIPGCVVGVVLYFWGDPDLKKKLTGSKMR